MTLIHSLAAICEMLRTQTSSDVVLGYPDPQAPGLCVWPWKVEPLVGLRPQFGGVRSLDLGAHPDAGLDVHILVLALPSYTDDGLSTLEAARSAILDTPILTFEGGRANLLFSALENQTLVGLFRSISLPVTACLSAILRPLAR